MSQSWSVIIFAYNEESSVRNLIEHTADVLMQISPEQHEIVVVNDGSTDNTFHEIEICSGVIPNLKIMHHEKNKGIGEALLTGYRNVQFENICAIPADGQFNPMELIPFAEIPEKTVISFYRTQKTRYTLFRKLLSYANRILNRFFLGIKIKDVNWVKVYKKESFQRITPILTSSLVESEIFARMLYANNTIVEVPSVYNPRVGGVSKGASLKTMFLVAGETLKLYRSLRKSNGKHQGK